MMALCCMCGVCMCVLCEEPMVQEYVAAMEKVRVGVGLRATVLFGVVQDHSRVTQGGVAGSRMLQTDPHHAAASHAHTLHPHVPCT